MNNSETETFTIRFEGSVSFAQSAHLKWRAYGSQQLLRFMRFYFLPLLVVVNGCGGASDPRIPLVPSLLITNTLINDKVYVAWNDAAGRLLSTDSIGPHVSNRCIRLRPVDADSAQWTLTATESVDGTRLTTTVISYWYHPGDVRSAEVLVFSSQQGSPNIFAWDSAAAVNGPVFGQTREVPPHC